MIPMIVDSLKVSLISNNRLLLLKEPDAERYLAIVIGPFEAEAIAYQMQGVEVPRPLTHDLLKQVVTTLGAHFAHVVISELKNDTFYATLVLNLSTGRRIEIDSRSSDAIALALRANVTIYVDESVIADAGFAPDEDLSNAVTSEEKEKLLPFSDFIESLDLDDLGKEE
ncbi:MAG: bifunctional nuclease family protein [Chloroflexi bacterium]|nr:bifunctional nuclease family protein [Chloroflexota bacterium]MBI3731915.1 bifunctional nuclease family protein [Chloroflexota bacterium]